MAAAGFFHKPDKSGDDRVFCFACSVCLISWETNDDPFQEHQRHSPTCPFISSNSLKSSNVPSEFTMANVAPLSWKHYTPQSPNNLGLEHLVVGSSSANTQWFGIALNDPFYQKPTVVLFHLDKVTQVYPYIQFYKFADFISTNISGSLLFDFLMPLTKFHLIHRANARKCLVASLFVEKISVLYSF